MGQIEIFKELDVLSTQQPSDVDIEKVLKLIKENYSTREYFYSKIPMNWVGFLNKNGFFLRLNSSASGRDRLYAPELGFLQRVVSDGGDQSEVVRIVLQVDCIKNFNPEVLNSFIHLLSSFEPKFLINVLDKAVEENWLVLLDEFNLTGHFFEPIVIKLVDADAYDGLVKLARLLIQLNKERDSDEFSQRYFQLRSLNETGIFEHLQNISGDARIQMIDHLKKVFSSLVQDEKVVDSAFDRSDSYYLGDVDFFSIKFQSKRAHYSLSSELKDPLNLLALLLGKAVEEACQSMDRSLVDNLVLKLPDTQMMWRLKLYVLSRCPSFFKEDLYQILERLFQAERYSQLLFGTEYLNALKRVFSEWSDGQRESFSDRALNMFENLIVDRAKEYWHIEQGWEIFSVISELLSPNSMKRAKKLFKKDLDDAFQPQIIKPEVRGGSVNPRSPIVINDIPQISSVIVALKDELNVYSLSEKYANDDFLNPRNAEGVADELKEDVQKRINDYLSFAADFFDDDIHLHYTHSFLRGVEEYLRSKKNANKGQNNFERQSDLNEEQWSNLFFLFEKLLSFKHVSVQKKPNEIDRLADWNWVESDVATLLQYFLSEENKGFFQDKRDNSFKFIQILLNSNDPSPDNEREEYGDLFHVAINTTRGKAFEAFVRFVSMDGNSLNQDVLNLYEETIKKASPSISFMIGRFISVFHFRGNKKVHALFEKIFPKDNIEKFVPAWLGFLSNTLYLELFKALENYYVFALNLDYQSLKKRKGDIDLEKGLGVHLALAFSYIPTVNYIDGDKHILLKSLFDVGSVKTQKEFVSYIGRGIISHSSASSEWFEGRKINLIKLKVLWETLLDESLDQDVYASFGMWVNYTQDVFDYEWLALMVAQTLDKSNGYIDWDHGIESRLQEFADANPEAALKIIKRLFVDSLIGAQKFNWFRLDAEKIQVFKTLYAALPEKTTDLINELLVKGGMPFWSLKDIPS